MSQPSNQLAFTSRAKELINFCLKRINLRLETLTADNVERIRVQHLEEIDYFSSPVFTVPEAFKFIDTGFINNAVRSYLPRFDDFCDPSLNDVGYTFDNTYYTSPDTEVLYALVRTLQPNKIIEVGSGNSTKIIRQALLDGGFKSKLISIDPSPRVAINELIDVFHPEALGMTSKIDVFRELEEGDILFIDSSHLIKTGNDVIFLFLEVLPNLLPGVLIHIHDIFLPYEYPEEVIHKKYGWNEQYLVQSLLMFGDSFKVLWAGHFLQRTQVDFANNFPHMKDRIATSLWLKKEK